MKTRILIVEDEPAILPDCATTSIRRYDVISAGDGVQGLGVPGGKSRPRGAGRDGARLSGLDVCKQLKAKRPSLPSSCSPREKEIARSSALELDDDYRKPFSIRELMAR
jgi:DNA-binding response OmpR family regulator